MPIRKKIRWWLKRKWKRFLYKRIWRYCPCCRTFCKIKWVQVVVIFEDEPPMFFYWKCSNCGARTPDAPTFLTEQAVNDLGYKDFAEYNEKLKRNVRKQEA